MESWTDRYEQLNNLHQKVDLPVLTAEETTSDCCVLELLSNALTDNKIAVITAFVVITFLLAVAKCVICKFYCYWSKASCIRANFRWEDTSIHVVGERIMAKLILVDSCTGIPLEVSKMQQILHDIVVMVKYENKHLETFSCLNLNSYIVFSTKTPGLYKFHTYLVPYGFTSLKCELFGSPCRKIVNTAIVNAAQTEFIGQSNGAFTTLTIGNAYYFQIQPKDRYKNDCALDSADFRLFSFECRRLDECPHKKNKSQLKYAFDSDSQGRFCLILLMEQASYWEGKISYRKESIKGGEFGIVCITNNEEIELDRILRQNLRTVKFEAHSETIGHNFVPRPIKLLIGLSRKYLNFSCKNQQGCVERFSTYRVSPRTKILFKSEMETSTEILYKFVIQDGSREDFHFHINSSYGRMLLSMYYYYIAQDNDGKHLSFDAKRMIFYEELASQMDTPVKPKTLFVSRKDVVRSTYEEIRNFSTADWFQPFTICFRGEYYNNPFENSNVAEWLSMLLRDIFSSNSNGMFTSLSTSKRCHPNPKNYRNDVIWKPEYYYLAGLLLAKYLVEISKKRLQTPPLKFSLSHSLLAQIIGLLPSYKYVQLDHPYLYEKRFRRIIDSSNIETLNLKFSEEFNLRGHIVNPVPLIVSGQNTPVKNCDKELYLNSLANYYMSTIMWEEIQAFLTGFYTLVPEESLVNFDVEDMEVLLKGSTEINKGHPHRIFGKLWGENNSAELAVDRRGPWQTGRDVAVVASRTPDDHVNNNGLLSNCNRSWCSTSNTSNLAASNSYRISHIFIRNNGISLTDTESFMEVDGYEY